MDIREYLRIYRRDTGRLPTVGFVGMGVSNLALISELVGGSYPITVRSSGDLPTLPSGVEPVLIKSGDGYLEGIFEDILFLSPSVRRDKEELLRAAERGVILSSDMELFFASEPTVYAVTGSDGKSTTATLAEALLGERHRVALVGNIGVPFSSGVGDIFVAELSSFQLSYHTSSVRAAVITSLSENHLDWHKSYGEYKGVKLALAERAARSVISFDSPDLEEYLLSHATDTVYSVRMGFDDLRRKVAARHYITLSSPGAYALGESDSVYILVDGEPMIDVSALGRREWYNISNLMGAMGLALGEYSREHLLGVAKDFHGLSDRCESVGTVGGVDYINSSIDTSPARMAATLSALGRRVSLILGGKGKRLSILPYLDTLARYASRITLYGEAGLEFLPEIEGAGLSVPILWRRDFDDAFLAASDGLLPGEALLLSPAATGYGEFRSYRERGERFRELVEKLNQ